MVKSTKIGHSGTGPELDEKWDPKSDSHAF